MAQRSEAEMLYLGRNPVVSRLRFVLISLLLVLKRASKRCEDESKTFVRDQAEKRTKQLHQQYSYIQIDVDPIKTTRNKEWFGSYGYRHLWVKLYSTHP